MASFAEFRQIVERGDHAWQQMNKVNLSIETEIDELHKIKETKDELQIMLQVANLQETIQKLFSDKESERFKMQQYLTRVELETTFKEQKELADAKLSNTQQQQQQEQKFVCSPLSNAICN